jgi:two-component system, oxyanion-binding sensor
MSTSVVIGFIPLLDCAPLAAAAEHGFAADEGLHLTLVRETSWANIRDRVIVGHFDAAHMLGPMAIASTLGIGHVTMPMAAPMALGLGGNAITVSNTLWAGMCERGARIGMDARTLGQALRQVVKTRASERAEPLTFAMVYPFSSHNYELRYWLAASGIDPDVDVRLIVLPPPLLVDALREGQIDGFCVGEPWSSLASSLGAGTVLLPTTAIWAHSPEKVLGCRLEWAQHHPETMLALVRAVHRAALWCADAQHHSQLAQLLSQPRYVGAPVDILLNGLSNRIAFSAGEPPRSIANFYELATHAATFPWSSHALWFYSQMVRWGQVKFSAADLVKACATYRPDLYRQALGPSGANIPTVDLKVEGSEPGDGFFDGRPFDPADIESYLRSFTTALRE